MDDSTQPHASPGAHFDWISSLVQWRKQQGLTQADVAQRCGLSLSTVKAYERGKRHPSRAALDALISALGIPREDANLILAGAGYAVDWRELFEQRYLPATLEDLQDEANGYNWPVFVTNQSFDVVAVNPATGFVFEVDTDTELQGFSERNLLGGITDDRFADHLENWDDVVTFMCGLAKGDPRWGTSDAANPAPWLARPMEQFLAGNPARVTRFFELWSAAPPIKHRVRQQFAIHWRMSDETRLRFSGRLIIADIWTELHWNEWVPADSQTWAALDRFVSR